MTSGGCGPIGAGHTNGAPQIRSAALGMTNKERVVVGRAVAGGKGGCWRKGAVAGGKGGCWRKGRLLEERAVAGGKGGCWRKGRLLEERAVAGGKGGCWRKGRLLEERAVAEPRRCLNPILAPDDLHATRIYSAKRASKGSTSYILKKPVAPLVWTSSEVQPSPHSLMLLVAKVVTTTLA